MDYLGPADPLVPALFSQFISLGFPDSSVGKESASNAGDPGSIPGSGRSPGEGIGYQLQTFWAFLVAQLVKKPSAMWETWVQSLGWQDPLEKVQLIYLMVPRQRGMRAWVYGTVSPSPCEHTSCGEHNMRMWACSPSAGLVSLCLSSHEHFTLQSAAPDVARCHAHFMQWAPPGLWRHRILE